MSELGLYIVNLDPKTREEDIIDVFKVFGEVTSAQVIMDPRTGLSRGFAFASMATPEQAAEVIAKCDGSEIDGKTVKVQKSRLGQPRPKTPGRYLGKRTYQQDEGDDYGRLPPRYHDDYDRPPPFDDRYRRSPPPYSRPPPLDYPPPRGPRDYRDFPPPYRGGDYRDPYPPRESPYSRDPYARDPYSRDPYSRGPDPYARGPMDYPPPHLDYPPHRGDPRRDPRDQRDHSPPHRDRREYR